MKLNLKDIDGVWPANFSLHFSVSCINKSTENTDPAPAHLQLGEAASKPT